MVSQFADSMADLLLNEGGSHELVETCEDKSLLHDGDPKTESSSGGDGGSGGGSSGRCMKRIQS